MLCTKTLDMFKEGQQAVMVEVLIYYVRDDLV